MLTFNLSMVFSSLTLSLTSIGVDFCTCSCTTRSPVNGSFTMQRIPTSTPAVKDVTAEDQVHS